MNSETLTTLVIYLACGTIGALLGAALTLIFAAFGIGSFDSLSVWPTLGGCAFGLFVAFVFIKLLGLLPGPQ